MPVPGSSIAQMGAGCEPFISHPGRGNEHPGALMDATAVAMEDPGALMEHPRGVMGHPAAFMEDPAAPRYAPKANGGSPLSLKSAIFPLKSAIRPAITDPSSANAAHPGAAVKVAVSSDIAAKQNTEPAQGVRRTYWTPVGMTKGEGRRSKE